MVQPDGAAGRLRGSGADAEQAEVVVVVPGAVGGAEEGGVRAWLAGDDAESEGTFVEADRLLEITHEEDGVVQASNRDGPGGG